MSCVAGEIWVHHRFYLDNETGEWKPKFLLILANRGGDITYRLLTSRRNSRPSFPPCFHGDPYPGFFIGVVGGPLNKDSWVDLRECEDFDAQEFDRKVKASLVERVLNLDKATLCDILLCTANAQDTTRRQQNHLYAVRELNGCR